MRSKQPASATIAAALFAALAFTAAAAAEPVSADVVSLFKEICVTPDTPEAMMAAGERFAAAGSWRVVKSGRGPIPMMHNENGPPDSLVSAWEFDFHGMSDIKIVISIVGPEHPDLRFNACVLSIPTTELDENLNLEVERQFGSSVSRRKREHSLHSIGEWLFVQDGKPDCRKHMNLSRVSYPVGRFTLLTVMDIAHRQHGRWQPIFRTPLPECGS